MASAKPAGKAGAKVPSSIAKLSLEELQSMCVDTLKKLRARDKRIEVRVRLQPALQIGDVTAFREGAGLYTSTHYAAFVASRGKADVQPCYELGTPQGIMSAKCAEGALHGSVVHVLMLLTACRRVLRSWCRQRPPRVPSRRQSYQPWTMPPSSHHCRTGPKPCPKSLQQRARRRQLPKRRPRLPRNSM